MVYDKKDKAIKMEDDDIKEHHHKHQQQDGVDVKAKLREMFGMGIPEEGRRKEVKSKVRGIGERGREEVKKRERAERILGYSYDNLLYVRSLALFRMGMAIATIGDLIERSMDLRAHYSDEGVFPRALLFESYHPFPFPLLFLLFFLCFFPLMQTRYANIHTVFIHAISGHPYFQAFVFLLHGFCALCMLVGWRTKTFTFLCWVFPFLSPFFSNCYCRRS